MSVLDGLLGKKKIHNWTLTELGKHKAEDMEGNEGIRLKIVSYIDEHGASSVGKIAEHYGYSEAQVRTMMNKLYKQDRWVMPEDSRN